MKKLSVSIIASLFVAEFTLFFGFISLADKSDYFLIFAGVLLFLGVLTVFSLIKKLTGTFEHYHQESEKSVTKLREENFELMKKQNENMLCKIDLLTDLQKNLLAENTNMCKTFERDLELINKMSLSVIDSVNQQIENLTKDFNKNFQKNVNLLNATIEIMHQESKNSTIKFQKETTELLEKQNENMSSKINMLTELHDRLLKENAVAIETMQKSSENSVTEFKKETFELLKSHSENMASKVDMLTQLHDRLLKENAVAIETMQKSSENSVTEFKKETFELLKSHSENMASKVDMLTQLHDRLLKENAVAIETMQKSSEYYENAFVEETAELFDKLNNNMSSKIDILTELHDRLLKENAIAIETMQQSSENSVTELKEETLELMKQQSESMKSNYTDAYSKLIESIEFLTEEYKKIIEDGIDGYQEGQKEWNTDIEEIIGEALDDYKKELNKQNRTLEELSYMVKNSTESYNNTLDLIKNNQESMNNLTAKDIKLIESLIIAK